MCHRGAHFLSKLNFPIFDYSADDSAPTRDQINRYPRDHLLRLEDLSQHRCIGEEHRADLLARGERFGPDTR